LDLRLAVLVAGADEFDGPDEVPAARPLEDADFVGFGHFQRLGCQGRRSGPCLGKSGDRVAIRPDGFCIFLAHRADVDLDTPAGVRML
jgi:hypothetical protein